MLQPDSDHELLQVDSEIPRRGGTDRRSELLYRTSKDLPSALQSRSRNRSTVHHGWLLERVVHWNPLHVRYENYPLASFLQVIVVQGNNQDLSLDPASALAMSERTIKAAQVFIGALPILLVYPFLQKYFVKGIVMGAVKE